MKRRGRRFCVGLPLFVGRRLWLANMVSRFSCRGRFSRSIRHANFIEGVTLSGFIYL